MEKEEKKLVQYRVLQQEEMIIFLFGAGGPEGIFIFDVSDPTNPRQVGSFNTDGYAYGVTTSGNYAYVADGANGLVIIDISDPTNPTSVVDMLWSPLCDVSF